MAYPKMLRVRVVDHAIAAIHFVVRFEHQGLQNGPGVGIDLNDGVVISNCEQVSLEDRKPIRLRCPVFWPGW